MASSSSFSISAEYLGWKPTEGLYGRQFVQRVVRDMLARRSSQRYRLKRHVLEFDKRKLRLWELDHRTGGRTGGRYPSVPVEDITFALQEEADTDPLVFSLILHGFNEESSRSIHVHVWRGFNLESVTEFAGRLTRFLTSPTHLETVKRLELQLVRQGEATPSGFFESREPVSTQLSVQPPQPPPKPAAQRHSSPQAVGSRITEELKQKLSDNSGAPLLHPPRDYDTVSRSHGNVMLRRTEQPLRSDSKAPTGAYIRRSEITDPDAVADEDFNVNVNGDAVKDVDEDPPPDYDTDDNYVEDDDNRSAGASTGTLDSAKLDASFVSSSGRSSISDHSADPARGFSTWRRRRGGSQLRQLLPGWKPQAEQPIQQQQRQSGAQAWRPPSNHQS